jgi:hypothetical protein
MTTVCYVRSAKRLKYAGVGQRLVKDPLLVTVSSDASDAWRLDQIVEAIAAGGVRLDQIIHSNALHLYLYAELL